jgi:hypothetical protein
MLTIRRDITFCSCTNTVPAILQAFAGVLIRPLLFWLVSERILVVICQRFGTGCRSQLAVSSSPRIHEDGTDMLSRYTRKQLSTYAT